MRQGGGFLSAAFLASLLCSGCNDGVRLNDDERELFSAIDDAISSGEPQETQVISVFDLPTECSQDSCFFESEALPDLSFSKGNFRTNDEGLILVLENWTGSCIRTAAARDHFNAGIPEQTCSHGGCWSTMSRRSWGIVSFGLDGPDAECVADVVINTRYVGP